MYISTNIFLPSQVTSVVMHLGEMKFKQKSSKDDQAVGDETAAAEKVAKLLGKDFISHP